jgi:HEPN domain-containing protein
MKGKPDLVQGWLKKAASDLVAMRASAQAGAPDAAYFHAQQAAEKYLKAYLADRDREVIHTHNLFKLLAACEEIDPAFSQLADAATLLTPFAVEARYDAEFWPTREMLEAAEFAANRVAKLVCSLVQSMKVMSPAFVQNWKAAREAFSWTVDPRNFKGCGEVSARVLQSGDWARPGHRVRGRLQSRVGAWRSSRAGCGSGVLEE